MKIFLVICWNLRNNYYYCITNQNNNNQNTKTMTMYKLMTSEGSCVSIHTKDLTIEEANTMRDHYNEFYPDQFWWIMPHDESDYYNEEPRRYSTSAVDGWEDLFDH